MFHRNPAAIAVTRQSIGEYLQSLTERGCAQETVQTYQRSLIKLYRFLPRDHLLYRDTLEQWRSELLRSYTARTVNVNISAANSYLEYVGAREFQLTRLLPLPEEEQPELTRKEYMRLLERASQDGNERAYLLTKSFALLGLTVQELPLLTVEAAESGEVAKPGGEHPVTIPACLRRELLSYARRQGVPSGPVFVTRSGRNMNRTAVTDSIQRLACAARLDPGKGNPRCLRKLYQKTQRDIWERLRPFAEQSHERLIDAEQIAIGWEENAD